MLQQTSRLLAATLAVISITVTLTCAGSAPSTNDQLRNAARLLSEKRNQEALQAALAAPADGPRNLLAGEAALRLKQYDEALRLLTAAEQGYPLLADIAASLRADVLFAANRFREAAAASVQAAQRTPNPALRRRMEKLEADALFEAGDHKAALNAYRQFISRHSLGRDHVDALFKSAHCQELSGETAAAVLIYRTIHLRYPTAPAAPRALEQLKALEKKGLAQATAFTPEEQLQRGELLLANNRAADAAWAFAGIPRTGLSDELLARIELKSGQAAIKQRNYTLAEQFLKRAAPSRIPDVRDEARLALARVEERLGHSDTALARLLTLAAERGPLADDALLAAGLIQKHGGRFSEAAVLLQRLVKEHPASDLAARAGWELAWGQYLAGQLEAAEEAMNRLLKDSTYRERALYWHARINERQNRGGVAAKNYQLLLQEYPFGFYAAWYRSRINQPTGWPALPAALAEPPLPEGSRRIQALAGLGMLEEARSELASFKPARQDRQTIAGLARLQQLAGDLHGSIVTFHQNRPATIEPDNLAFWAIGFPRPYTDLFSRYSATYRISDALTLALAKAESSFRADVKSHAGAIGLMQLMPATAQMTAGVKGKAFNPLSLTDPEFNIKLGTKHLRELLDQYQENTVYTLAAYNAGAGAVKRWRNAFGHLPQDEFIENIPFQETRDYVKKIIAYLPMYRALYSIK
ncbi:MAG: tetratricopeptide repeat protein [Geobacter sp.]|nr:tetratricopeptide repeat protein [Geobacter sp.]